MGSVVIVGVNDGGMGWAALLVSGVELLVGPPPEEGLVETSHFSIGLGSVGSDQSMGGADLGESIPEIAAATIVPRRCRSLPGQSDIRGLGFLPRHHLAVVKSRISKPGEG